MGCWNETCALTKTPIVTPEECWMLLFQKKFLQWDNWWLEDPKLCWVATYKGSYDDYGWLDNADRDIVEEYDGVVRVFVSIEAMQYAVKMAAHEVKSSYHYKHDLEIQKLFGEFTEIAGKQHKVRLYAAEPFYVETMCAEWLAKSLRSSLFGSFSTQNTTEDFCHVKALQKITNKRFKTLLDEEY